MLRYIVNLAYVTLQRYIYRLHISVTHSGYIDTHCVTTSKKLQGRAEQIEPLKLIDTLITLEIKVWIYFNEASEEFYANDGTLSEETIEKFSEMSSTDLVLAYWEIQANNPQASQGVELSESQVNQVQNAAGGEANYNQVINWAAENLNDAAIDAFDSVVDSGNPMAIQIAFQGLQAEYNDANGYEGRMLQGKAASSAGETFRSQAALVSAMADPRYDTDEAYRDHILRKLNESDLQF